MAGRATTGSSPATTNSIPTRRTSGTPSSTAADRALLVAAGLPEERTHLLPNAVTPPRPPEGLKLPDDVPATVLYPVRGIRRKNLGEFCLLSALAPDGSRFAMTLAPENPEWRPIFDRWRAFAQEQELPVQLGVVGEVPPTDGADPSYENWLAWASHLATTSIAEGFGLAFLEPIGLAKPLLGRDLPEITIDFKQDGLQLGRLYEALLVPADWIDLDRLRKEHRRLLGEAYASYRTELDFDLEAAFERLQRDGHLDFGNLPETLQEDAIAAALADPARVLVESGGVRQPAQFWLGDALSHREATADRAALADYSVTRYGSMLETLYRMATSAQPGPVRWLAPSAVLRQFLKPERFHFLRS